MTYNCIACGARATSQHLVSAHEFQGAKVNSRGLGTWHCPKGCYNKKGKTPVKATR